MENGQVFDMTEQLKDQSFFKSIVIIRQLFVET